MAKELPYHGRYVCSIAAINFALFMTAGSREWEVIFHYSTILAEHNQLAFIVSSGELHLIASPFQAFDLMMGAIIYALKY